MTSLIYCKLIYLFDYTQFKNYITICLTQSKSKRAFNYKLLLTIILNNFFSLFLLLMINSIWERLVRSFESSLVLRSFGMYIYTENNENDQKSFNYITEFRQRRNTCYFKFRKSVRKHLSMILMEFKFFFTGIIRGRGGDRLPPLESWEIIPICVGFAVFHYHIQIKRFYKLNSSILSHSEFLFNHRPSKISKCSRINILHSGCSFLEFEKITVRHMPVTVNVVYDYIEFFKQKPNEIDSNKVIY